MYTSLNRLRDSCTHAKLDIEKVVACGANREKNASIITAASLSHDALLGSHGKHRRTYFWSTLSGVGMDWHGLLARVVRWGLQTANEHVDGKHF